MADPFSETAGALDGLAGQMTRLEGITGQFGKTLSKSLVQGIAQGKDFEDILKGMGDKLVQMSLSAALKPAEGLVNSVFGALAGTAGSLIATSLGAGNVGGGTSAGLFGASARAAAGPAAPMTINMAVSTPDAESFRRAESQVSAALARAVARGQRSL